MAMLTSTALALTAMGVAGGASVAGAKMASGAAKDAAQTQVEASDKALALQREMYQQERADTAPWRNVGGQSVQTLGALMGLPSGPVTGELPTAADDRDAKLRAAGAAVGPPLALWNRGIPYPSGTAGMSPNMLTPGVQYGGSGATLPGGNPGLPSGMTPQSILAQQQAGPRGMPTGAESPGQAQSRSSYVQMRAPTGETQAVPAHLVAQLEQQGAVRV
jgi:hypothetical protein